MGFYKTWTSWIGPGTHSKVPTRTVSTAPFVMPTNIPLLQVGVRHLSSFPITGRLYYLSLASTADVYVHRNSQPVIVYDDEDIESQIDGGEIVADDKKEICPWPDCRGTTGPKGSVKFESNRLKYILLCTGNISVQG